MKQHLRHVFLLFLLVFTVAIWIPKLQYISEGSRLTDNILENDSFRRQPVMNGL